MGYDDEWEERLPLREALRIVAGPRGLRGFWAVARHVAFAVGFIKGYCRGWFERVFGLRRDW
jgi:hypothetical protein